MTDQNGGSRIADLFRAYEQRRRDRAEGIPRVGGDAGTDYRAAYFSAARLLLDATTDRRPDMAMPIAYLQRHALELALKSLIEQAYDVHSGNQTIAATERAGSPTYIEPLPSPTGHKLADLAGELRRSLALINYSAPPELLSLVDDMASFEDADETRFRYATGKRGGKYSKDSFPSPVIVPIIEWQQRLDGIERDVLTLHDFREHPPTTLVDDLYLERDENNYRLYALGAL